jgi:hypothetical protein
MPLSLLTESLFRLGESVLAGEFDRLKQLSAPEGIIKLLFHRSSAFTRVSATHKPAGLPPNPPKPGSNQILAQLAITQSGNTFPSKRIPNSCRCGSDLGRRVWQ